jgi:DNA-binding NarL/FixJ family response regulator
MNTSIRVLIIDDYEPWRRFALDLFQQRQELQVIGEGSDGVQAVEMAQRLQPDLILLDIGLPRISGIEAARQIRGLCPRSKILFMSENRSAEVAQEALSTGGGGYVVKSGAASELLPAIKAVLEGKQFISPSLTVYVSAPPLNDQAAAVAHRHEVAFYPNDVSVLDGYARFIEYALSAGNAVIVVVTELHRASLIRKLQANGVNVAAAIEQGRYVPLDAAHAMVTLTVNDTPDPILCAKVIGDVVRLAAQGVRGEHARVMVCGEIAPTMLSKGNAEGAIRLEHLWDEITRDYGVHTHCGYIWSASPERETNPVFERICAEHSAVHGRELVR